MDFGRVLSETLKALRESAVPAIVVGGVDRPTVLHSLDRYELAEYRRALGFDA